MSDSYQAVYDAVRSRISNGDIGAAVERALSHVGNYFELASRRAQDVISLYDSPSAIYRPKLSVEGNKWCALYGDNLQDGVAGFGDSPAAAMWDFDCNWTKKLAATKEGGE